MIGCVRQQAEINQQNGMSKSVSVAELRPGAYPGKSAHKPVYKLVESRMCSSVKRHHLLHNAMSDTCKWKTDDGIESIK